MNVKRIFSKTLIIGLALSLAHCSPKESSKKRKLSDGDYEAPGQQELVVQNQSEADRLQALLDQIEPIVEEQYSLDIGAADGPMLLQKAIMPLKGIALNSDYLLNPENRYLKGKGGQPLIPRLVTVFNQAVVMVYQSNPDLLPQDILPKYKAQVLYNCEQDSSGDDLRGSCDFIKFYRMVDSNNMSYIMKLIHDQEEDGDEKLIIIKADYDIKNRRLDGPLRFMLVARLAENFKKVGKNAEFDEKIKQEADLFANMLKINNIDGDTKAKIRALIKESNPLLLSRNVDDPRNPALTDYIKLAGRELVYEGDKLTNQINVAIDRLGFVVGPQYEQGVDFQKANINGQIKQLLSSEESPELVKSKVSSVVEASLKAVYSDEEKKELVAEIVSNIMSVPANPEVEAFGAESKNILTNMLSDVTFNNRDEYFFLAHQVFYGHLNVDDAASFWTITNQDQERFMQATMDLIKMQIVNSIVYTNTRMNDFYNKNKDSKLIELIRESDKEASKIRKAWTKLIIRARSLKTIASRVVVVDSPEKRKQIDQITKSVDALKKNIKFLVAYPNMFPLMHYMASQEMKETIQTFFGAVTIDSQLIIDYFFAGGITPFFNFGNDGNPLDSTEIIYSYYYALTTEIFSTYSTNEKIKFSPEEFFKVVVKKLVLPGEIKLDNAIRSFKETQTEYENATKAMQKVCSEEQRLQKLEKEQLDALQAAGDVDWTGELYNVVKSPRYYANNQLIFTELGTSIYDPTSNRVGKIGKYLRSVLSTTHASTFDLIRTNQFKTGGMQSVQLAKTLFDVYKTYNKDGDPEKMEKIFKEQFAEFNRLKAEYVNLFLKMNDEVGECEWTFMQRDKDLRQTIFFREMKYLGEMFDAMEAVLGNLTEEQRGILSNNILLAVSDEDFENLSAEDKQKVTWGRQKRSEIEAKRKELFASTQASMFPQEYKDRYGYTQITGNEVVTYQMDVYARLMSYLNEMFPGQYNISKPANFEEEGVYKESGAKTVYFDWSESDREKAKKKFVSAGVKVFAGFITWAGNAPEIGLVENKAKNLVSMYKLNKLSLNKEIDCKTISESSDEFKNNCMKVTAKELIDYYKRILHAVNIDERDEIVLDQLGKDYKYTDATYHQLIKKQGEHVVYSYYDLIFRRVVSDTSVLTAENTWFLGTLLKYVDSVHKRQGSTFIFDYPEAIEQTFVKYYRVWLDDYFANNIDFLKEVKRQLNEGVEPFVLKYRTDSTGTHMVGAATGGKLDPLISKLALGKFNGFVQQMDNDTSRYFYNEFREHKKKINAVINGEE